MKDTTMRSLTRRALQAPRICFGSLLAVFLAVATMAAAAKLQPLTFETSTGSHVFQIEEAVSEEQRRTGLMYRRSLAEDHGMLFDFGRAQEVSMWMQNTYVSLDMVFVAPDGRVTRIADNAEPLSTRIIGSNGPARYVVEIAGGVAKKIGLKPGDRVVHPRVGA